MTKRTSLAGFGPLAFWFAVFFVLWGHAAWDAGQWSHLAEHWDLAMAMALRSWLGSVAPVGGGMTGLPWLFEPDAGSLAAACDFGFAVQAVGMTSAVTFVLCRGMTVDWSMVRSAAAGSLIGLPLGLTYLAPLVPTTVALGLYCGLWGAVGLSLLSRADEITDQEDALVRPGKMLATAALVSGGLGAACLGSVLGSGGVVPFYAVMLLLRRVSLRTAMASCVVLMGFNAVLGLMVRAGTSGLDVSLFERWLVAAPIACVGAPLGLMLLERGRPVATMMSVGAGCLALVAWMALRLRDEAGLLGLIVVTVGILYLMLGCRVLDWMGMLSVPDRTRTR